MLSVLMPDMSELIIFIFFFQAEDGIRDLTVTGVQTCALPILEHERAPQRSVLRDARDDAVRRTGVAFAVVGPSVPGAGVLLSGAGSGRARFIGRRARGGDEGRTQY